MSDYEKQAEDFLKAAGVVFRAVFLKYGKYWEDDNIPRNIYRLELRRQGSARRISFRFGQSLAATDKGEEPTAYDLLACLTKYDPGPFSEFCASCGYDEDSRRAFRIWGACRREWAKVARFFTAEELTRLQEIN